MIVKYRQFENFSKMVQTLKINFRSKSDGKHHDISMVGFKVRVR